MQADNLIPNRDLEWLSEIGDLPDHYYGHAWSSRILPNNFLFFQRENSDDFKPLGVTHNLHHRYEIAINFSGSACICLNEVFYDFQPGCAVLVPPGAFHRYFDTANEGLNWLFFTFELGLSHLVESAPFAPVVLQESDFSEIKRASQLYLNPRSELDIFESSLAMGRLAQRFSNYIALKSKLDVRQEDVEASTFLRRIARFVDEHMEVTVRIIDIANHLEMSESNLRKVFRERFDTSLGLYLSRSRLTRGVQLIHNSDLSISEVAKRSGFEMLQSFSQSFNRAIGMPPTAYRKWLNEKKAPHYAFIESKLKN